MSQALDRKHITDREEFRGQEGARAFVDMLLARTGLHATDLARLAKINQVTVTQGRSGARDLSRATIEALAGAAKLPAPADLLASLPTGRRRGAQKAKDTALKDRFVLEPEGLPPTDRVRLLATPSDGPPPFFRINFGVVTDSAPRPPGIRDASNVFAFRMPEGGMAPWRQRGELIYADPGRVWKVGDHALLRLVSLTDPGDAEWFAVAKVEDLRGPGGAARYARHWEPDREFNLSGFRVSQTIPLLELADLLGA